jgi:hypothetical protein
MTEEQLEYLKAVIEGRPLGEPWRAWFARNEAVLAAHLSRGLFLRLKVTRIRAIPEVLGRFGAGFAASTRYDWLGDVPGRCRDYGANLVHGYKSVRCPKGCLSLVAH